MKSLFLGLLIILSGCFHYKTSSNKTVAGNNEKFFIQSTKFFIDILVTKSIDNGKYNVYAANIYNTDGFKDQLCLGMGYIVNEKNYKDIQAEYVYYSGDEIVLIHFTSYMPSGFMRSLKINPISVKDSVRISSKLYPADKGYISGASEGMVFCNRGGVIKKKFYENTIEIPSDRFIYKPGTFDDMMINIIEPDSLKKH